MNPAAAGEPLRVGVAGLGTVGAGVLALLRGNRETIAARCGRPVEVVAVSARDRRKDRGVSLDGMAWIDDPAALADRDLDAVVEAIGGADGPARALVERALARGIDTVTANKALIAHHGAALAETAEATGAHLGFEAAVAGGIPIVKALREGLAANRLERIYGILNGTCNYMLTDMRETGRGFDAVLAEAQALGYAEADPGFDVDGVDTAHKLAILASLAFGGRIDFESVFVEGIRGVEPADIAYAEELGYRVKLLGVAARGEDGLAQWVYPCMTPRAAPIAAVDGVLNAVVCEGAGVGATVHEGRGAGAGPTASAAVADLVDIARGVRPPAFSVPVAALDRPPAIPIARRVGACYVRLAVVDRPGAIAGIAACLRDRAVSIETLTQRVRGPGGGPGGAVPVVMTTHDVEESAMRAALDSIAALDSVAAPPRLIRIESL